jgi:DNA (cytosine-5)-methyltransferase 1
MFAMIYGSVCSGIEAASVAWHPLGWRPAFFSEVDAFPRALLAERWPGVPVHGDFTTIDEGDYEAIDLLVGGTPCQDFSVAGLRAGFTGDRGNLTLEFVRLARRLRPRWLVWENVPGLLSIDGGGAFAAFLGLLGQCGYGFAYRVLDAQHFGVPQRRRRVFVVGYLGDWRPAAAVLFEPESLRGDLAPSREARERVAGTITRSLDRCSGDEAERVAVDCYNGAIDGVPAVMTLAFSAKDGGADAMEDLAPTLRAMEWDGSHANGGGQLAVAIPLLEIGARTNGDGDRDGDGIGQPGDPMFTLQYGKQHGIAHSLRAEGFDASEDGTGRGTPLIAVDCYNGAIDGDITHTARSGNGNAIGGVPAVMTLAFSIDMCGNKGLNALASAMFVRRLTPRECERLQGFPDDYTLVAYRGKPAADGPRYRALGNSMAVPVMHWIGGRVALVDALLAETRNPAQHHL